MATKNTRVNITLGVEDAKIVAALAKRNGKSISGMLRELVLNALELERDISLSKIAELRDQENAKRVSHEQFWK